MTRVTSKPQTKNGRARGETKGKREEYKRGNKRGKSKEQKGYSVLDKNNRTGRKWRGQSNKQWGVGST